jgi:hypothetical protein
VQVVGDEDCDGVASGSGSGDGGHRCGNSGYIFRTNGCSRGGVLTETQLKKLKTQLKNAARIVLKPDETYFIGTGQHRATYRTDGQGRLQSVSFSIATQAGGGIRPANTRASTSWDTSYLGYSGGNGLGRKGDIGFHLMGDQFYGSEYYPNLVPGNSNLNGSGGAFGTLERLWSTAAENGKRVNDVTIDLSYPPK